MFEVRADRFHARGGERDRQRRDEVADLHRRAVGHRPELEHLGGELVTHDEVERGIERHRRADLAGDRHQLGGVMQRVQIRAADPARLDGDQRVARAENRARRRRRRREHHDGQRRRAPARYTWKYAESTVTGEGDSRHDLGTRTRRAGASHRARSADGRRGEGRTAPFAGQADRARADRRAARRRELSTRSAR